MLLSNQSYCRPIPIPLYSSVVECEVNDSLASLKLTQRFFNDSDTPLECLLRIPIDQASAVIDLTVTTDDGCVMHAKVEDKDTARERYSDAISSGHTAILGEAPDETEFTLNIGNLAPHSGLQAAISLVAPLSSSDNKWLFAVPQWVTSSWSKPPISPAEFRTLSVEAQRNTFGFQAAVLQRSPILSLSSPSHEILVDIDEHRLRANVTLKSWTAAQCIELEFETQSDVRPKLQTQFDSATGEYVGMLSFLPPLLEAGQTTDDIEGKGDFVLLLDRSGSMEDARIEMARQAAILFIKSLSEGNRFNVVSFGSSHAKLFPSSQPVSVQSVSEAVAKLSTFTADMGGTDILGPLLAVYQEISDMPRSLYLLTDGEVDNKESVIRLIEQNSRQARVHAFGIGSGVDRDLITEVAKAAKGCSEFISDLSDIKKKVVSVLKRSLLPALSHVQVSWPLSTYEQFPSNTRLPVCYFGELVVAYVHYGTSPPQSGHASLSSVNTASRLKVDWEVAIDTNSSEGNGTHKLWAKQAITELSIEYAVSRRPECLSRIQSLSKKYGIPSEHTSLLCVVANAQTVDGKLEVRTIAVGHRREEFEGYAFCECSSSSPAYSRTPPPEDYDVCLKQAPGVYQKYSGLGLQTSSSIMYMKEFDFSVAMHMDACANAEDLEEAEGCYIPEAPATKLQHFVWQHASLMDIIERQEINGLWLATTIPNLYANIPEEFAAFAEKALDLWTTLCVVVLIQVKFAKQADEWDLVIRKASRALKAAGVDATAFVQGLEAELAKIGLVKA